MQLVAANLGLPAGLSGWKLLSKKAPADFKAFTADPILKREIAYFRERAPGKTTADELMKDPRLQDFVLRAYGLSNQIGMTALMAKVLGSDPDDPKSTSGRMTDYRYREIARAFNYGKPSIPAIPAIESVATVFLTDLAKTSTFESFEGRFGGITISDVDLSGATTASEVASKLQAAFQRADGNREDITVSAVGFRLKFTDAKGRGSAASFVWTSNGANAAPPAIQVQGRQATAEVGGPKIKDTNFVNQVIEKYTQARFEEVVGNSSEALRKALYAKRQLPRMTNWYSVIADRPLADVVQTVLGLPESFGRVDVDKQKAVLEKRMNIADFSNSAKVETFLNRYIAMSGEQTNLASSGSSGVAALQMFSNDMAGSTAAALFSMISSR